MKSKIIQKPDANNKLAKPVCVIACLAALMALYRIIRSYSIFIGEIKTGGIFELGGYILVIISAIVLIKSIQKGDYLLKSIGLAFDAYILLLVTQVWRMFQFPTWNIFLSFKFILDFVSVIIIFIIYRLSCANEIDWSIDSDNIRRKMLILSLIPIVFNIFDRISVLTIGNNNINLIYLLLSPYNLLQIAISLSLYITSTVYLDNDEYDNIKKSQKNIRIISIIVFILIILFWLIIEPSRFYTLLFIVVVFTLLSMLISFLIAKFGAGAVKGGIIGGLLFGWVGAVIGAILGGRK